MYLHKNLRITKDTQPTSRMAKAEKTLILWESFAWDFSVRTGFTKRIETEKSQNGHEIHENVVP